MYSYVDYFIYLIVQPFQDLLANPVPLRDGERWIYQNIHVHEDVATHAPGA